MNFCLCPLSLEFMASLNFWLQVKYCGPCWTVYDTMETGKKNSQPQSEASFSSILILCISVFLFPLGYFQNIFKKAIGHFVKYITSPSLSLPLTRQITHAVLILFHISVLKNEERPIVDSQENDRWETKT